MIRVSAYKWVPPFVQGLVRDLRVRWALEEIGLPYEEKLLALGPDQASAAYRALQPFGQVPAYEEDDLTLFESGAIVLHIGEKSEKLLPREPKAKARATTWMFAALNTVEPPIMFRMQLAFGGITSGPVYEKATEWTRQRLRELAAQLKDREYLTGAFTAGDLLMANVLNELRNTDFVAGEPVLDAYKKRCETRPAYQKAMRDQLAVFAAHKPPEAA
ncbi:MAG TPA: glutathione S-transferase family protein [Rhizomicrobium sp.]|jgi:glutathione S-transferase